MKPLTRCVFCDQFMVREAFVCGDCRRSVKRIIAVLILPAAIIGQWLVRWAWRGAR